MKKLIASSVTLGLQVSACLFAQADKKPNVIYIFPDQFRNHAMGFWNEDGFKGQLGSVADPVVTPNLNKFARESVVLSSAQSNFPLSSPHRGMFLTGMYPHNSGVTLNCNSDRPFSSLRNDATTISDVFSQNSYQCAYIGKLHAEFPTKNNPQNPGTYVETQIPAWDAYTEPQNRHGFDFWYSYGTFDQHKTPHYWDRDGKRHEAKEWSPKHEADVVIDYLKNERDDSKPFFLVWSLNPPHSPYRSLNDCMEEDLELYKDTPLDQLLIRPNVNAKLTEKQECAPFYFASVTGVDREFGRVLATLTELGLDENTIVVFTSDHGETMASHVSDPKNSVYAESMNVPFMVRYPNHLQPKVTPLLLSSVDIMPTVLSLAGLENEIPASVQGDDLTKFLKCDTQEQMPEAVLYMRNMNGDKDAEGKLTDYFAQTRGVKTNRYSLAISVKKNGTLKEIQFFDDEKDPYQMNNLSVKENKEVFASLCGQLGQLLERSGDRWYEQKILSDIIPYKQ